MIDILRKSNMQWLEVLKLYVTLLNQICQKEIRKACWLVAVVNYLWLIFQRKLESFRHVARRKDIFLDYKIEGTAWMRPMLFYCQEQFQCFKDTNLTRSAGIIWRFWMPTLHGLDSRISDTILNSYKLSLLSCRPTDSTVDRTSPFFIFLSYQKFPIWVALLVKT